MLNLLMRHRRPGLHHGKDREDHPAQAQGDLGKSNLFTIATDEVPIFCRLANIDCAPDSLAPELCPNRNRYAVTSITPVSIQLSDEMALSQR